jgi:hypothetical protein
MNIFPMYHGKQFLAATFVKNCESNYTTYRTFLYRFCHFIKLDLFHLKKGSEDSAKYFNEGQKKLAGTWQTER